MRLHGLGQMTAATGNLTEAGSCSIIHPRGRIHRMLRSIKGSQMAYTGTKGRQRHNQRGSTTHKMRQPRSLSHSQHRDRQAANKGHQCMLPQLTKLACPRHSRIRLHQNGRECGRFVHQASGGTEASTVSQRQQAFAAFEGISRFY